MIVAAGEKGEGKLGLVREKRKEESHDCSCKKGGRNGAMWG
jgi:hypothetical protein